MDGAGVSLGYRSIFALAPETAFGTGPSALTGASYFEATSVGMKTEIEEMKSEEINTTRSYMRRFQMNRSISGSIEKDLHPVDGVQLLVHAIGGVCAPTGTSTTGYIHTITPDETNIVKAGAAGATTETSLSLFVRKGADQGYIYTGCRVGQMTVTGEIGSPIKVAYDVSGKAGTTTAALTDTAVSFSSVRPFLFKDAHFYYASTTAALTSTAAQEIQLVGFELTVNNNIDTDQRALGQDTVIDLPPGRRDVSLKLTMRYDTTTSYTRFNNGEYGAGRIVLTSAEPITGTTYYSLQFDMPKMYWNNTDPEIGEAGVIQIEPELTCIRDVLSGTTAYDIKATLQNLTASY
jgi:hypothetical protein